MQHPISSYAVMIIIINIEEPFCFRKALFLFSLISASIGK